MRELLKRFDDKQNNKRNDKQTRTKILKLCFCLRRSAAVSHLGRRKRKKDRKKRKKRKKKTEQDQIFTSGFHFPWESATILSRDNAISFRFPFLFFFSFLHLFHLFSFFLFFLLFFLNSIFYSFLNFLLFCILASSFFTKLRLFPSSFQRNLALVLRRMVVISIWRILYQ